MAENTSQLGTELDPVLAQMLGAIELAPEPGALRPGSIVNRTVEVDGSADDEDAPTEQVSAPIVAHTVRSAGYCWIYDTRTGQRSRTNLNMLRAQLGKRRVDGSFIFTKDRPKVAPPVGKHKCLLHELDPGREKYAEWGFQTCPKANLMSEFQVDSHMAHRHKQEWETIKRKRQEERENEDRALQRAILEQAARAAGQGLKDTFTGELAPPSLEPVAAGRGRKRESTS